MSTCSTTSSRCVKPRHDENCTLSTAAPLAAMQGAGPASMRPASTPRRARAARRVRPRRATSQRTLAPKDSSGRATTTTARGSKRPSLASPIRARPPRRPQVADRARFSTSTTPRVTRARGRRTGVAVATANTSSSPTAATIRRTPIACPLQAHAKEGSRAAAPTRSASRSAVEAIPLESCARPRRQGSWIAFVGRRKSVGDDPDLRRPLSRSRAGSSVPYPTYERGLAAAASPSPSGCGIVARRCRAVTRGSICARPRTYPDVALGNSPAHGGAWIKVEFHPCGRQQPVCHCRKICGFRTWNRHAIWPIGLIFRLGAMGSRSSYGHAHERCASRCGTRGKHSLASF